VNEFECDPQWLSHLGNLTVAHIDVKPLRLYNPADT